MKTLMRIPFVKLEALGNDFIVASPLEWIAPGQRSVSGAPFLSRLAKAICERHTGVGADGLLLIGPPKDRKHHARVRFFNADGSEAEMSGNGIRCAAAGMMETRLRQKTLKIETLAGVRTLEHIRGEAGNHTFRVSMGKPILEPELIPFRAVGIAAPVVRYSLATRSGEFLVTVTSMGNPHCSLFVESFDELDWPKIGSEIETHPLFPNRTNVEFVRIISRQKIEVRYWERGVGVTASSGTGSSGAVVASILNGFTGRRVRVETLAGALQVEWPEGGEVILTGPAQIVVTGDYAYRG
ncbi:MAG TPA: diaminopimelate epimerase [Terriglobia bacterium]|nr:diaminopimelate epimerase [Terriglobia bacterium]